MSILLLIIIPLVFYLLNALFSSFALASPFECGIETQESSRSEWSFYFLYVIILFILFDVELCCLLPFISFKTVVAIYVISLILVSTLIELQDGALSWVKKE